MVSGVGCFIFLIKSGCSWEKNWWAITIFMIKSERFPPPNFFPQFLFATTFSFPNLRDTYVSLPDNKDYKPFISIWSVPSVNQMDSDKAKSWELKTHAPFKEQLGYIWGPKFLHNRAVLIWETLPPILF